MPRIAIEQYHSALQSEAGLRRIGAVIMAGVQEEDCISLDNWAETRATLHPLPPIESPYINAHLALAAWHGCENADSGLQYFWESYLWALTKDLPTLRRQNFAVKPLRPLLDYDDYRWRYEDVYAKYRECHVSPSHFLCFCTAEVLELPGSIRDSASDRSAASQEWDDKVWAITDEFIDFLHDPSAPTPLWEACSPFEQRALRKTLRVVKVLASDATERLRKNPTES